MADVKWIKIVTDIFDDEKILLIESLPSSDSIIVIWFKLLTLAGKQNNNGVFLFNSVMPYTEEMLATIFRRDVNVVRMALQTFEKFGMVDIVDNVITIPNWGKHQSLEKIEARKEYQKKYQREYRERQKMLAQNSEEGENARKCLRKHLREHNVNALEEEREIEEDIEEEKKRERVDYSGVKDAYNSLCPSLPAIKALSDSRKRAIKARLKDYTLEDLREAFKLAEESNFLKGENERSWKANFDWLMKEANLVKVLEGNYKNKEVVKNEEPKLKLGEYF